MVERNRDNQEHSGFGFTSSIIAAAAWASSISSYAVGYQYEATVDYLIQTTKRLPPQMPMPMPYSKATGTVITFLCYGLPGIGIVFGIAGLLQRNRRKSLAIAGLISNGAIIIGSLIWYLYALTQL